jgi:hypothetical protein
VFKSFSRRQVRHSGRRGRKSPHLGRASINISGHCQWSIMAGRIIYSGLPW